MQQRLLEAAISGDVLWFETVDRNERQIVSCYSCRSSVEEWINENHTDPATKAPLIHDNLYPNLALRDMIQAWLVEQKFVMT